MRCFFRDCQEWGWIPIRFNPSRVLRTPRSVLNLIGPAPRVISREVWAKLLWAAMNLEYDDLPLSKDKKGVYPLELVRAVAVQAVKNWLQTHRDWLPILDNADDLTLLPAFLSPTLTGHVLLTTRAVATGRLAHRLEIETLPPEQGALFILRRAALLATDENLAHVAYQEQERARQISQNLGGLPLALDQAGADLEETGCGLADYQQLYRQHRDELLRKRGELVADHPEPVATTWSLSFQQALEKHPAASDLLCMCAYLAPDVIPEEILTAGASFLGPVLAPVAVDPLQLNQALEALRD